MSRYFIYLLLKTISMASCANILGIIPTPAFSHQTSFWPIWKELSLRGHNVTVATTDPINDPQLTNLTEINIHHAYRHVDTLYGKLFDINPIELISQLKARMLKVSHDVLSNQELQQLIKDNNSIDLLIVETFYPEMLMLGDIFKCPKVLLCSFEASSMTHQFMGNQMHAIGLSEYNLPFAKPQSFIERLVAFVIHFYLRSMPALDGRDDLLNEYFGKNAPSAQDLYRNVDLVFLNTNPILGHARAVGPSTIFYGGFFHIRDEKPLPADLQNFLDNAKNGAIYFSLGSTVKSKNLEGPKLDTILKTLSELPYQILWKFEDDLPNVPKNVKIIKWGPQQDILRHPNIKAFITQAGLQSLEEAIHNDIPMVVLPVYGDQTANAKRLHEKGLAIMVEHKPVLSGEKFKHAILEVINNLKYKDNVKHMHRLILDQPMTGIEKVVWWTEYVIRNKGAKHLRPNILNLPLYQYYYLDIWAFILAVLVVLYQATKYTIRLLRRCLLMPLLRLMSPRASRVNSHKKRR